MTLTKIDDFDGSKCIVCKSKSRTLYETPSGQTACGEHYRKITE